MLRLTNQATGNVVSSSNVVVMANGGAYDPAVLSTWFPRRPYYLTDLLSDGGGSSMVDDDRKFEVDLKFTGEINKKSYRKDAEPFVKASSHHWIMIILSGLAAYTVKFNFSLLRFLLFHVLIGCGVCGWYAAKYQRGSRMVHYKFWTTSLPYSHQPHATHGRGAWLGRDGR